MPGYHWAEVTTQASSSSIAAAAARAITPLGSPARYRLCDGAGDDGEGDGDGGGPSVELLDAAHAEPTIHAKATARITIAPRSAAQKAFNSAGTSALAFL
ncbi:hypothetical protein [Micromonospora sp. NPDC005806]|uniref:hypothetical protein n=1 Tax=Micromonospora sp. NPDC005806 TaxID=3364234 RepID=UPI0036A15AFF